MFRQLGIDSSLLLLLMVVLGVLLQAEPAAAAGRCERELFEEVNVDGRPKYWAQMMMRGRSPETYLTKAEMTRPRAFAAYDLSQDVNFDRLGLQSCLKPEQTFAYDGVDNHVNKVVSLVCSSSLYCSITSSGNGSFLSEQPRVDNTVEGLYLALKQVADYNTVADMDGKIRVVNISLPGEYYGIDPRDVYSIDRNPFVDKLVGLLDSFNEMRELNIIWAAGNDYGNEDRVLVYMTGRWPMILPVSAISLLKYSLAVYSNFGHSTRFAAPVGGGISSVDEASQPEGTSFAAPLVAGSLLTLHQVAPYLDALAARAILRATAFDLGAKGFDPYFGFGMPNVPLATAVARRLGAQDLTDKSEEDIVCLAGEEAERVAERSATLQLIASKDSAIREKATSDWVTYDHIEVAHDCTDYGDRFDQLMLQYFYTGGAPEVEAELCRFYRSQQMYWGVANYCPLATLWSWTAEEVRVAARAGDAAPWVRYKDYLTDWRSAPKVVADGHEELAAEEVAYYLEHLDFSYATSQWGFVQMLADSRVSSHAKFESWLEKASRGEFTVRIYDVPYDDRIIQSLFHRDAVLQTDIWRKTIKGELESRHKYRIRRAIIGVLDRVNVLAHEAWAELVELAIENLPGAVEDSQLLSLPAALAHPEWFALAEKLLKELKTNKRQPVPPSFLGNEIAMQHPKFSELVVKAIELQYDVSALLTTDAYRDRPEYATWQSKFAQGPDGITSY